MPSLWSMLAAAARTRAAVFAPVFCLVMSSVPASAAPGDLDVAFAPSITNDGAAAKVFDVVSLPNGQTLIAGEFTAVNGQPRVGVARLNADGSVDATFPGPNFYYASIHKIAVKPDGSMYVGGNFYLDATVASVRQIAELTATGAVNNVIDLTSPHFFTTDNIVYDILIEPGGSLVIGGTFYYLRDVFTPGVARLTAGSGDVQALGPAAGLGNDSSGSLSVRSVAIQADGKLLVGGEFLASGGRHGLVRLTTDPNIDVTFVNAGTSAAERVNKIIVEPDGKILVAGNFVNMAGQFSPRLARLNTDGSIDGNHQPIDLFQAGAPLTMRRQADGRVLLGGILGPINGQNRNGIARLLSDFTLDSFYPNPNGILGEVWAIDFDSSGRVLAGGFFNTVAGVARPTLARLLDQANAAPQLTDVSLTPAVDEGSSATLSGSVADADAGDQLTLSVNWGDGSAPQTGTYASGANFSLTHQYADDNPTGTSSDVYTVTVSLGDGHGGSDSESPTVTINNAAPSIATLGASPNTISAGGSTTLSGTLLDAGALDSHTVVIAWGDGTSDTTLPLAAGALSFSSAHQYSSDGGFTIAVSLSDDDGGVDSDSVGVTVNPVVGPPAAPTALNAIVTTSGAGKKKTYSASLTWTDNASNETGFIVRRFVKGKKNACLLEAAFAPAPLAANTTSYTDPTATASTCGYQVAAVNAQGTSAFVRDLNIGSGITP